MRRGGAVAAVAAALITCGCTPRGIHWEDQSTLIQPQPQRAQAFDAPHGYLVVQLPPNVGDTWDENMQHYPPVYVYDRSGTYVRKLANNTEYPTPLAPGDYIVLVGESDAMGEFHQVQVHIGSGKTTAVTRDDIANAPHFWELSRTLAK